ncbi:hypothetical protein KZX37_00230 [Microbacterium sp. EYE_5]|uniref:hypothetical protein n=1 Tax=unclassified Microbacterium TaxID=2609290 RepID=UPI00200344E2|nr:MULTISPECIES: hypothetical protein [unclassified Microbacterium]MCK6079039.1 hypothetical protein [Microbacterium sp. EYE_382]MCK6084309.1 hypothetical protein [Microbacterium sp. EYE_384]MCK6123462.1 hypothetical protein [Microbacterium sp. EYE_80]MCK6125073.1 hypothetical protein [Microbacterium sp. EYE_79]MCK6139993.1 hypothetical protein [Microbacterium sp. EYE_39]
MFAAALLVLTGCTAVGTNGAGSLSSGAIPSSAASSPSPTPTIDPGPVELSAEEAARRYLAIMCDRNAAVHRVGDAFADQEDAYWAGDATDVAPVNDAAADAQLVGRRTVELIDDSYYVWPEGISEHLKVLRASELADAVILDAWASARSFDEAMQLEWPTSDAAASAQEIRYLLDLPANTDSSCAGFEGAGKKLHSEMLEREEYLAQFAE